MNFTPEFDRYLKQFRLRLKQLVLARGIAIIAYAALVITLVAVAVAIRNGFPDDIVVTARFVLVLVLVTLAYRYVILPRRRVDEDGAADIERRTKAFGGRVETYTELDDERNPMRELLAEDATKIAREHPPDTQVEKREFLLAYAAAAAALATLLFFAVAGPGNYAYGVRHLWFGWALPGLLPPQSIEVIPGDDGIRLGGTVRVRATMQGFDPARAWVHASFGDGEWQRVEMSHQDEPFEFTFFSVRQPLEYYVSAANVRSPTFNVNVVDLPVIENLALTYNFPEWTRREPEIHDPGGDVRAIAETEVELRVTADRQMTPGELVVDERLIPLEIEGATATARFTVTQDGQYFVAAKVGGEQIRLTDDYFITRLDDEIPRIEFARPGRDWNASSIEEVTASVSAQDDFALESLELRYSVNGGAWQTVELPVQGDSAESDHVFFLESLARNDAGEAMSPGDLITYYAVAGDRESSASTDMFFIDVQPFDRRYSQSQQGGGAMGGQQGGPQTEISDRQREIIVSTWNLIREQQENKREDPAYVSDNAALLSRVQETLRGQVETLAQRAHARLLTASDEQVATFTENLTRAGEAMIPAAERLGVLELEHALLPEQEALQHLLAAEAVFTDISVSLAANNRGRGGQAGRDLTEMFELEMDLEKNQYESGSTATPNAPQQELEDTAEELGDLARRQEQLARNFDRNRVPTPAQRWQQEMLRRDVEELRDRLERMQREARSRNSQAAQRGEGNSSGRPGGQGQQGETSGEIDELRRRLESAVRAMNEADEAMRANGNPDNLRRASAEAQRQLEGARQRALEEQQRMLRASVNELTNRADELYETQAALEDRLQDSIRGVLTGRNDLDRLDSGLTLDEEYEIAEQKRRLQAQLQALEQDARNTARVLDDAEPRAAEEIRKALDDAREMEIDTRLAVAAAYIEQGEAIYIAGSESAVTQGLRELRDDLRRAEDTATQGNAGPGDGNADNFSRTLAETQRLRRELQRLAGGVARGGAYWNQGPDDWVRQSTGIEYGDLEFTRDLEIRADAIAQNIFDLFRDLRAAGAMEQDIDHLRRLAVEIRASDFSGNPALLDEEARRALSLVEQMELALSKVAGGNAISIRTNATDEVSDEHKEIVADYYRRLGQAEESAN